MELKNTIWSSIDDNKVKLDMDFLESAFARNQVPAPQVEKKP